MELSNLEYWGMELSNLEYWGMELSNLEPQTQDYLLGKFEMT